MEQTCLTHLLGGAGQSQRGRLEQATRAVKALSTPADHGNAKRASGCCNFRYRELARGFWDDADQQQRKHAFVAIASTERRNVRAFRHQLS